MKPYLEKKRTISIEKLLSTVWLLTTRNRSVADRLEILNSNAGAVLVGGNVICCATSSARSAHYQTITKLLSKYLECQG